MAYSVGFLILSAFALVILSQSASDRSQCFKDDLSLTEIQLSLDQIRRSLDKLKGSVRSPCPTGFRQSSPNVSKCYAIIGAKLTWDAAQLRCRQLNPKAHLIVINSALENQILSEFLGNYECYGEDSSPDGTRWSHNTVWIAGQRKEVNNCNTTFVWKPDNSTYLNMTYTNFHPLEPNCAFEKEACVAILLPAVYGKVWNDYMCSWSMCSVCEFVLSEKF